MIIIILYGMGIGSSLARLSISDRINSEKNTNMFVTGDLTISEISC